MIISCVPAQVFRRLLLAETASETVNDPHPMGENRDLRIYVKMPRFNINEMKQAGTRSFRPNAESSQQVMKSRERGILRFTGDLDHLTISQLVSKVVSWSV